MHPIKNHRIVCQGAATVASGRDHRDVAIESAATRGWSPEQPRRVSKDAIAAFPAFQPTVMPAGE
jgi:hypothetical protein